MTPSAPAAELAGVSFRYAADRPWVLEDVDLAIGRDDFLGLLGPNGGGKTTLLHLLLGLVRPQRGTVRVLGQPPSKVRSRVGYVPQHARIDSTAPADVLDVVLTGRLHHSSWGPRFGRDDVELAVQALEQTGTADLARRPIAELSGGQRQRVLIARALATRAEILLLDEPTTAIDLHHERELLELLVRLRESIPVVLVSHDVSLVSAHLDRAAWVNRRVRAYPAREISLEKLEEMYHP